MLLTHKYFKSLSFILIFGISISCSKSDAITNLSFQKSLLAGKGTYLNTQRVWRIDSMSVNDTTVILTNAQKMFTKTYLSNGNFYDKDGVVGKWDIATLDNLKEYLYDTNGRYLFDSLSYHIDLLSSSKFIFTLNSSKKIKYIYVISN
jgi:hypothetical protein